VFGKTVIKSKLPEAVKKLDVDTLKKVAALIGYEA
jgi:hypothetical protein